MGPAADDADDGEGATRRETLRFDFDEPATSPGDVRQRMVQMTERARSAE
jgi:hypothetical protein